MTSTRLTQQNRSQGWAAALSRCYPHTPSPTPGSSWHGSDAGSDMTHIPGSASYETHARTRVGGWVLRGGYADSVPRGPDHPTGGRYPRPPPGRSPPLRRAALAAVRPGSTAGASAAAAIPHRTMHACARPVSRPPSPGGRLTPPYQGPRIRAETSATSAERRRTRPSHRATRAPVGVHTTHRQH